MSRSATRTALALALLLATATSADARPGRAVGHPHNPGFFLRLAGGLGFGSAVFDDADETTFRGVSGNVDLAIGATITRNLALHLDIFGLSMFEPSIVSDGADRGQDAEGTTMSLGAIGVGVTGFIMPLNLYVSGAVGMGVGIARTRIQTGPFIFEFEEDTDPGLAINLMVGKEWLISRRWGVGLAAQVIIAALETDDGAGLGVLGFGLLFSATTN